MSSRAYVNIALSLFLISIAFLGLYRVAQAGYRTFSSPWGPMVGNTYPGGSQFYWYSSSQAGNLNYLGVHLRGWGACSPDMSCTWQIKNQQPGASYWTFASPTVSIPQNYNTAVSKHTFQLTPGSSAYSGYTLGDSNNVYGTYRCWSAFTSRCNR